MPDPGIKRRMPRIFAGGLKNRRISSCFAENSDYINRRQQMREEKHWKIAAAVVLLVTLALILFN